jgi:hypothetical protein
MADTFYRVYRDLNGVVVKDEEIESPTLVSDPFKISNCQNVLVENCRIVGGSEDCVDQVAGRNTVLRGCRLKPIGKNGVTAKGSVDGFELNDVLFETHGSECDAEFGQHCKYDSPLGKNPTKNIRLINVRAVDGRPVVCKIWNATKPTVIGGNVKVVKVSWIVVKAYFLWRWIELHWLKKS